MNQIIESFINSEDMRTTAVILAVAAVLLLSLMLYGIREFTVWLLKINSIEKTQKLTLDKLSEIQEAQRELRLVISNQTAQSTTTPKASLFPLNEKEHSSDNSPLNI